MKRIGLGGWRKGLCLLGGLLLCLPASNGCRRSSGEQRLTGGGSTFINPIMTRWISQYHQATGVQVDYTASGSGNGIRQMVDEKNDFGCTDAPMTAEQRQAAQQRNGPVLHIPLVMGAVVPAYNLPQVTQPVRLTGPILADIFLGRIKKWNDPALKKINPEISLPDLDIAVVHRSDGSGTTYIWSYYLSKVSPAWKEQVGYGTDLRWPTGVGEPGNPGVAGHIGRTPGALGYVELTYVLSSKGQLSAAAVQNRHQEFLQASLESVTRAAEGEVGDEPEALLDHLTDSPNPGAYPICGATWAVLYEQQPAAKLPLLRNFLHWCLHEGQEFTAELHYARLPASLVPRCEQLLQRLRPRGQ
jgi:phosphate ABC transporter phosphate-binding protein